MHLPYFSLAVLLCVTLVVTPSYSLPIDVATTRQDVVTRGFSWSYLMPRSSKSSSRTPTPVDHPGPPLEQHMELHIEGGMPTQIVDRLSYDFQGSESVMYALPHGWYDVPALAKTPTIGTKSMDQERAILEKVGQFLFYGKDAHGRYWLVMKDVRADGLVHISDILEKQESEAKCLEALEKAVKLTVQVAQNWYEKMGILHFDLQGPNVFFDPELTKAVLVDWGNAEDKNVNTEFFKDIRNVNFDKKIWEDAQAAFHGEYADICSEKREKIAGTKRRNSQVSTSSSSLSSLTSLTSSSTKSTRQPPPTKKTKP